MRWNYYLKIADTIIFQNSLKKCACENDQKYTTQFNEFYASLIENKIIQQLNNFYIFNQADHFIKGKYMVLQALLKPLGFKECTKKQILEFYISQTDMNVVNKKGGRKTRRKKRSKSIFVANSPFGDSNFFSGPYPKTRKSIGFKKVIPSKN